MTLTPGKPFHLLGREWELLPGVFSPMEFPSTKLFTSWLPFPIGGTLLEIGSGTGVTAVSAVLAGCAAVTAVDINPEAVRNTVVNAERAGVAGRVTVLESDLFASVPAGQRFDVVFWNSAFVELPDDHVYASVYERAFFDAGYRGHRGYLERAREFLSPTGRLLLGFSSLGNAERLAALADEFGWTSVSLASHTVQQGDRPEEYSLLELVSADAACR